MQTKRGVLSKIEKTFIDKHFRKRSSEEIASDLNRSVEIVKTYILEQGGLDPNSGLLTSLRSRPEWESFQLEFSADELEKFEHYYIKLMRQFDESEMLATEEIQVFDFIRCELHMSRNLREQKKIHSEMEILNGEQDLLRDKIKKCKPDAKRDLQTELAKVEERYNRAATNLKDVSSRYLSADSRKSQLLKELKGTRADRVKQIEGSKHSYIGLLKALMQESFRDQQQEQLQMMQLATLKERERLSAPHKFQDGVTDQPLLTPTTVLDEYAV